MTEENRKIAFICSKGSLDMAYPALIMGWAALGNGIEVTIFFTFWGLDLITEKRIDRLQLAPLGNPSLKPAKMGIPMGDMGIPNFIGGLPGMTPVATAMMKNKLEEMDVPTIREYLEMLSDGGAELFGCKMTVDMFGLSMDDFIPQVSRVVTASDFMDMTEGAQIVFI